ncbi:MAG: DNA integrity scanning protein DisA [Desulfobacter sp.]|nr:MAG: DNA integrity scanning protein DisA [Desulfobacter sp.]
MIAPSLLTKIKMVAPGTSLRRTLDEIVKADFGTLLVFLDDIALYGAVLQGGFDVNCEFSGPRLYELAKMDGAVIVNENITRIYKANVHLIPDPSIPTEETGMRHRAAERIAKQTSMLAMAISRRRKTMTIYLKNFRHRLNDLNYLLTRINLALEALEKNLGIFHQLIDDITIEEIESQVRLSNVIRVILKACEMMSIYREIEPYVIETGSEGHLYSKQLNAIAADTRNLLRVVIMDYSAGELKDYEISSMMKVLNNLNQNDKIAAARMLGWNLMSEAEIEDIFVSSRCYRFLTQRVNLPMGIARNVVKLLPAMEDLKMTDIQTLQKIEGIGEKRARAILMNIKNLDKRFGYR